MHTGIGRHVVIIGIALVIVLYMVTGGREVKATEQVKSHSFMTAKLESSQVKWLKNLTIERKTTKVDKPLAERETTLETRTSIIKEDEAEQKQIREAEKRKEEEAKRQEEEAKKKANEAAKIVYHVNDTVMASIPNEDMTYTGCVLQLSESDRALAERLVQGESGGQDVLAAALVAQAIRDAMVVKGYTSISQLISGMGYTDRTDRQPNGATLEAVHRVFDLGESAVRHRVIYFYAPKLTSSSFHESQLFLIEYGGHRFFDMRK